MQVQLLESTPNAEKLVARAAKQCYDKGFVGCDYEDESQIADMARIRKVVGMGHHSVLEHANYTFGVEGISRACSHQLVRFRHASYSQQSQRYCTHGSQFPYVIPPSIEKNPEFSDEFEQMMLDIGSFYNYLVKNGVPAEDARFVLPNACHTNLVFTMNARELHHAFKLRCCVHAQWEIRDLFNKIKDIVKEKDPLLFENVGAPCDVTGTCPEGPRSCGKLSSKRS